MHTYTAAYLGGEGNSAKAPPPPPPPVLWIPVNFLTQFSRGIFIIMCMQAYTFPCSLLLHIILPYVRLHASSPNCCVYSVNNSVYLYLYNSNDAKSFRFDQTL